MNAKQLPKSLIESHIETSAAFKAMRFARSKATVAAHTKAVENYREAIFAFVGEVDGKPDQAKFNATKEALSLI